MKDKDVMFCEECETKYDLETKYCPKCGSPLERRKIKVLDINISSDCRIILKLSLIKGKVTRNEMALVMGERTETERTKGKFYGVIAECMRLGLVYEDGVKYTSFGPFPALSVNKEKWAEFVENHEKLKEYKKYLDEAESEIY